MFRLNPSYKRFSIHFIICLLGCVALLGLASHKYTTTQARTMSAAALPNAASKLVNATPPLPLAPLVYNETKIVAPDGRSGAQLGAVEIDGNTLVIGASGDTVGANLSQGSAYVYVYDGTNWVFQQKLTANDGKASDLFGSGVGIKGDTIVVGASQADLGTSAANQGAAYVFVRNGNTWTEQAKLFASDAAGGDEFGRTVSISGDSIIVGARLSDRTSPTTQIDSGAAYVFVRNGATWAQQAKLLASDGVGGDNFGWDVGISGDTAVVSAWFDTEGINTQQGSAYIFTRNAAGLWSQQTKILADDGLAGDWFGSSAAIDGDTVVIGARQDNHNPGTPGSNSGQGSAYIYARNGTTWTLQQKIIASDPVIGGTFGESCSISGDAIIIGAFNVGSGRGAAYLYQRVGTNWPFQQKFTASDGAASDFFGDFVAVGNYGAVASAFGDDIGININQGSVYVYRMPCGAITLAPASLPNATAALAYDQTLTASGGAAPYSFSVDPSSTLPGGLTLSAAGLLSGTPTVFGTFNFIIKATDLTGCAGMQNYSLVINPPCGTITVNPSTIANGVVGTSYSQSFTQTGGTGAIAWNVSAGTLPGGLSLNSGTGTLTGTPNAAGAFNFTVKATDANGCMGTRAYIVNIGITGGLQFYALSKPVRILDTRSGQGNCDNVSAPINGGSSLATAARLTCEGITIPSNAQAIVGNVTVINQTNQAGYLTIYPDGQTVPLAANMIYGPNGILANNFTVGLSANGSFDIFAEKTLDAIVDISGYYAPPATGGLYYHPLPKPVRLLDTRAGQGNCDNVAQPITAGTSITKLARGTCEGVTIPAAAQAVVGNATVINGSGQLGYLTLYPNGVAVPLAANLIYFPGQILSNAFTVSLDANGNFNIFGEKTIDVVIDVAGYYSNEASDANGTGLLLTPLSRPLRILDTRASQGNCDAIGTPITGGNSIATAGRLACESLTIPATAQSILGNITVINQTGSAGYLTLYPDGVMQPTAANMIYSPNQILSNAFVVGLNAGTGQFRIFAERTLDAIVDASGYFAP